MATLIKNLTLVTAGVSGGVYTSSSVTIGATLQSTLAFTGNFGGATSFLETSTFNDGVDDVWSQVRVYKGPTVETLFYDEGVSIRVVVRDLSATSDITITTGGGNT